MRTEEMNDLKQTSFELLDLEDGKSGEVISFRVTPEVAKIIDALSKPPRSRKKANRSEFCLEAIIEKIQSLMEQRDYLNNVFGMPTNTQNTKNTLYTSQKSSSARTDELNDHKS